MDMISIDVEHDEKRDKKNNKQKINRAPIADFLIENKSQIKENFHALPISRLNWKEKGLWQYKALYGNTYLSSETTITGKIFDSFFYPTRAIKRAQNYAAQSFGANDTLFVTCGTSVSNQIVVDALITENSRVLLDREAHQSMHFAVRAKKARTDYIHSKFYCEATSRKYFNIHDILDQIKQADEKGKPYDVVILTASSYDGVINNIYEIIRKIIDISTNINFIIDEAWSSLFYFHPSLYKYTAGYAAKKLNKKVNIVSTQSAHKSLMALRQASFIHSFANEAITDQLYKSRFKLHSTSPNYPILASLDLARRHMEMYGENCIENALHNTKWFKDSLVNDPSISFRFPNNKGDLFSLSGGVCDRDPLKIHLLLKDLSITSADLQEYLYTHFGLYFNRYTSKSILINIGIGISEDKIHSLLNALRTVSRLYRNKEIMPIENNDFIIPYPPGVPLLTPGEQYDCKQMAFRIQSDLNSGINVFKVS